MPNRVAVLRSHPLQCANPTQLPENRAIPYAHSKNHQGSRHDLVAHLRGVAGLAAKFAEPIGAGEAARWVGLWHDIGKFHPEWQRYLLESEANPELRGHGPDHKAAGAWMASRHAGPVSMLVQGHHGGLRSVEGLNNWLAERQSDPALQEALRLARQAIPDLTPESGPGFPEHVANDPLAAELFLRLLFSTLVDADFLDTEAHFHPERGGGRSVVASIDDLLARLHRHMGAMPPSASPAVNDARSAIYSACIAAGKSPPGIFRLTAPTGSGKTLAGMAFALQHAAFNGHRRVIVAVPFISITEQTADVYRSVFESAGDSSPAVLEHHSEATAHDSDSGDFSKAAMWARLAAENWDAPVVVTTTVQLFESLFSNAPGRTRKIHRLANSVIILDEAQALPPHLLAPVLDAIQDLAAHYGTTVVLSTATQPSFESIPAFAAVKATEIVPEPGRWFDRLRRVTYEWRTDPPLSWQAVAELVRREDQALAVLNTKRDAVALLDALGDPRALHLSTSLCGAHRRTVIAEVKRRLDAGEPCRLISTQVVEAGVDLDFPVVLRAMGPLDSIIQAAGRCNREGRMERPGRVIVFRPAEGGMPPGSYKVAAGITGAVLGTGVEHPDMPGVLVQYFRQLYQTVDVDGKNVQPTRKSLNYQETAKRFQMIDGDTESLVVTSYGSADERRTVRSLLEELRADAPDPRRLLRLLHPYVVSVRSRVADQYRRRGLMTEIIPGINEWHGRYDDVRGVTGEGEGASAGAVHAFMHLGLFHILFILSDTIFKTCYSPPTPSSRIHGAFHLAGLHGVWKARIEII